MSGCQALVSQLGQTPREVKGSACHHVYPCQRLVTAVHMAPSGVGQIRPRIVIHLFPVNSFRCMFMLEDLFLLSFSFVNN